MGSAQSKPAIVIAIDFGSSYVGYAYSYLNRMSDIHVYDKWGADFGTLLPKTPTVVVYDTSIGETTSGNHSLFLGFEAESRYLNENPGIVYKDFKMELYERERNQNHFRRLFHLKDIQGKNTKQAMDVFSDALCYLKEQAKKEIRKRNDSSLEISQNIRWVVTVPAMWGDKQKMFMREACLKAGIIDQLKSQNLVIALEPECASLCCKKWPGNEFVGSRVKELKLQNGTKYMVVDLGGGTVDIAVHEVISEGVKEVIPSEGHPFGGGDVNKAFEALLAKSLGEEFIKHMKETKPKILYEMMLDFEKTKKAFSGDNKIYIKASLSLISSYRKFKKDESPDLICRMFPEGSSLSVSGDKDKIIITCQALKEMFDEPLEKILHFLSELLNRPVIRQACLKYIFLVGGFMESKYSQEKLKNLTALLNEPKPTILIPHGANLCVLRGAVLYGHDPKVVKSRVSKYTYFLLKEGAETQYLERIISRGTSVSEGYSQESLLPVKEDQFDMDITVYSSEYKTASGPEDERVSLLGSIRVNIAESNLHRCDRPIKVIFTFGKTELEVRAVDSLTNEEIGTLSEARDLYSDESSCAIL